MANLEAASATARALAVLLDRRFRKYRIAPPRLAAEESRSEARLLFRFRAICVAVFVVTCLTAYLLHKSGARAFQGF